MSLKERYRTEEIYNKKIDGIARDIVDYDFSGVDPDDTSEACYNLARDLYDASAEEADEIVKIVMDKYVQLIDG